MPRDKRSTIALSPYSSANGTFAELTLVSGGMYLPLITIAVPSFVRWVGSGAGGKIRSVSLTTPTTSGICSGPRRCNKQEFSAQKRIPRTQSSPSKRALGVELVNFPLDLLVKLGMLNQVKENHASGKSANDDVIQLQTRQGYLRQCKSRCVATGEDNSLCFLTQLWLCQSPS